MAGWINNWGYDGGGTERRAGFCDDMVSATGANCFLGVGYCTFKLSLRNHGGVREGFVVVSGLHDRVH